VPFYEPVPQQRQKEAVRFLTSQLDDLEWLDNKGLMTDMALMGNPSDIVREYIMKMLLGCPAKVDLCSSKSQEPYTVEECLQDVFDYVWGPAMRKEKLTSSQMKMQKLFLKNIGQAVGIKFGTNAAASIHDMLAEKTLMEFYSYAQAPISASSEPNVAYYTPRQYEEVYYDFVLKTQGLLKKCVSHRDKDTGMHYRLMLVMLNKSLK
jgi:hypothetical protein